MSGAMQGVTWPYPLIRGHSNNPAGGACALDAVNWLVHGEHGDRPACVCPVIARYVMICNDKLRDDERQRLLPYLHRIAGSRDPSAEAGRQRVFTRAAARLVAPLALEGAGWEAKAAPLRLLPDDFDLKQFMAVADYAMFLNASRRNPFYYQTYRNVVSYVIDAIDSPENAGMFCLGALLYLGQVSSHRTRAVDMIFEILDQALNAGAQGEPWSADVVDHGERLYRAAGGARLSLEVV